MSRPNVVRTRYGCIVIGFDTAEHEAANIWQTVTFEKLKTSNLMYTLLITAARGWPAAAGR